VRSVGCGAPGRSHCSPAREHDSRPRQSDASWRGYGLLADLAYASLARWRACDAHGVRLVIRLTDTWKPQVDDLARGQLTQEFFAGTDLDALRAEETLRRDGQVVDADVPVGKGNAAVHRRLVGVPPPTGSCVFLTPLPPRLGPRQVANLYRVRGEVARSLRLAKSVNRLDAIDAERPCPLKPLLHASRIASTIAALLAPTHKVQTRPQPPGARRTEAPLHPRRLALPLAVSCQSITQAFERQGAEAPRRWNKSAALLTHAGRDPNWRRRPSVLAQLRGWKRQPLTRNKANSGDVSHRNFKAAA
jgi:hypothetical protein